MPDDPNDTKRLRVRKQEQKTEEREKIDASLTPDEEHQHRRRADKAAYLEEKLRERERSER